MNKMLELRKQELEKYPKMSFDTFHMVVSKCMPSVNDHPAMYDLCYDLMKLSWETARLELEDLELENGQLQMEVEALEEMLDAFGG